MNLKKFALGIVFSSLLLVDSIAGSKPESCLLFSIAPGNKARLGVVNTGARSMNLEISNSSGSAFFTKSIGTNETYFQLLDLSKMTDGEYMVKLYGPERRIEKKFVVTNKVAKVIARPKDNSPIFKLIENEDALFISYSNSANNNVSVFFESYNDVLFEDRDISGTQISKKYSLKQLPKGEYTVKVNVDGKVFPYLLTVK